MQKILSFVCVFCFALTFVGCSPASEKGKWTEDDKKAVKTGFIDVAKKTLAANGQTVEDAVLEKIADCFTSKVEAEFASTSEYDKGLEKRKEISDSCAQEAMGGTTPEEPMPEQATDSTKTGQ